MNHPTDERERGLAEVPPTDALQPNTLRAAAPPAEPADRPAFGLLDLVEAFTAMRHEWKLQTRETRGLGDLVGQAVQRIEAAAQQFLSLSRTPAPVAPATGPAGAGESRRLALALAEVDETVERAVTAALQFSQSGQPSGAADPQPAEPSPWDAIRVRLEAEFAALSPWQRWLSGPWHRQVVQRLKEQRDSQLDPPAADPVAEGLTLMRERVRRVMRDCELERIDVLGQQFDPALMNAIDSVAVPEVPSGSVIEQLRPAYRWKGERLKDADVRIAR